MNISKMLSELKDQRDRLDRLIVAAEEFARAGTRRRGRPPKWMQKPRRGRPPGSKNKPQAALAAA